MTTGQGKRVEQYMGSHYEEAVAWRRALHRCPQPAWLEFYATSFIAEKLTAWGYQVLQGREIIASDRQLLPPDQETLDAEYRRAIEAGAREEFVAPARGGFTGVVGILEGTSPGPTVAFRFDIDSNEVVESGDPTHRPVSEGFASNNPGYAHMCGHDAHISIGLLLARYLADHRDEIRGKVKFLFQPNEENLSGALAMVDKGLLDDVDCLFGAHVGLNLKETGEIGLDVQNFLALTRFEVTYTGRATHAGVRPNEGKNALLGACAAVSNLYAIARHGAGPTRVNVGVFNAGTTWNVIPDRAYFRMETRGATNEINDYMLEKAREVLEGAGRMYDLGLEMKAAASSLSGENTPELIDVAARVIGGLPGTRAVERVDFGGSEDVTVMMERVQRRGGKALFVVLGTPTYGGHHSSSFDLDEKVIEVGAAFFATMYDLVSH